MPAVNIFSNAAVVPAKQTKAKTKKQTIQIEGLAVYAQIVAAEKALAALKETYRVRCEEQMIDQFIIEGKAIKRRPENFRGEDGSASASCELRKRSSASGLNEAEVSLLKEFGVSFEVNETTIETYVINPAYKDDQAMLGKVSAALGKVKDLPSDFIMLQQGAKKTVVTETSLDEVFSLPEEAIRQLISVVGTTALKPKTDDFDVAAVLTTLAGLVEEVADDED